MHTCAQICGTIKWRLNNKSAKIRQQAADLIARIAPVMKACDEEGLLGHLGVVLYEYLGEEYPEVRAGAGGWGGGVWRCQPGPHGTPLCCCGRGGEGPQKGEEERGGGPGV